jgi:hypothetical protein
MNVSTLARFENEGTKKTRKNSELREKVFYVMYLDVEKKVHDQIDFVS